jgi:hypothetical protein
MKMDNKSAFHDNHIKKIINFVMPPLVKYCVDNYKLNIKVMVRAGNGATGQTNCIGKQWNVFLQVPTHYSKYPYQEQTQEKEIRGFEDRQNWVNMGAGTTDYIPAFILTREEHLVHTAAHELRHIAQHLASILTKDAYNILPPEVIKDISPTPSGQFSDKDADRYAIRKQREWRRIHNQPIYQELIV